MTFETFKKNILFLYFTRLSVKYINYRINVFKKCDLVTLFVTHLVTDKQIYRGNNVCIFFFQNFLEQGTFSQRKTLYHNLMKYKKGGGRGGVQ